MRVTKNSFIPLIVAFISFSNIYTVKSQAKLIDEVKVADKALHFNGKKIPQDQWTTHQSTNDQYDFAFGRKISASEDCIVAYKDYVFMVWYKGGMTERNVMLSRYNTKTKKVVTIQFPHRHTGFQNNPGVGESHNTAAIGVSPIDETIHLLYDMHAYSPRRPANGVFKNDYFRYQYSVKNAASLPDNQFTLDKFNPKQLYLNKNEDYEELTYPNFFTNTKNELFVWIRRGGHTNGKYMFAKYDGTSWTKFREFNTLSAKRKGGPYNWGLYGDIKFEQGKMRIGFHTRISNDRDVYTFNNGFHYAYTDDPEGMKNWYTHNDKPVSLPVIDPRPLKFSEPGDQVQSGGSNSVRIIQGADWTVTKSGDIHFVTRVQGTDGSKNVHTYKKAGANAFRTSTNFPGGELYAIGDDVYLVGLDGNGRPFIERAEGGTNNWENIYKTNSGKRFWHGEIEIKDGILYYFLMERSSGSGQPIHLLTFDLGIDTTLSVSENESAIVKVFPNPAKGKNISIIRAAATPASIALFDITGKSVFTAKTNQKEFVMKDLNVTAGIYMLKIKSDIGVEKTYKVIFE